MEIGEIAHDTTMIGEHHPNATRLTDDLLVEIFSRLPVRSLYRFACACKSWHAIITNNDYYRKKLPTTMSGLFYTLGYAIHSPWDVEHYAEYVSTQVNEKAPSTGLDISTNLSFLPQHSKLNLLSSCNGLILCKNLETYSKPDACLYVCNPATKKYDKIPVPTCYWRLLLAFDPRISPHYKVVAISLSINWKIDYMEVLSSETREWVKYKDFKGFDHPGFVCYSSSVFIHGNIYFLVDRTILTGTHHCFIVAALDIEKKAFREIKVPGSENLEECFRQCFEQFEGNLRCALETRDEIIVWDLMDYDTNQWIFKVRVRKQIMCKFIGLSPNLYYRCKIAALHLESNVIFIVNDKKLFSYNFITSNTMEVCTLKGNDPDDFITYSPCYSRFLDL